VCSGDVECGGGICQAVARRASPTANFFDFCYLLFSQPLVRMSRRRIDPARISNHQFDLRGFLMRIISCREDEGLVIGDDICVTVLQIQSDYVRLAISCPQMTPSYREETLFFPAEEEPGELQLSAAQN
jgi:carbon storage regulator CsrA